MKPMHGHYHKGEISQPGAPAVDPDDEFLKGLEAGSQG